MKSFIKTLGIIVLAAVIVFSMAGCSSGGGGGDPDDPNNPNSPNNPNNPNYNPGNPNGTDEPPPPPPPVDAQAPNIATHPISKSYSLNDPATALSVTATSPDNGTLSYQWYRYKKDGLIIVDEEQIDAAINRTYTPPTNERSLWYYYVKVTNTITDNGDGGTKTAHKDSNAAYIAVAIPQLNIIGLTAQNKTYDRTTTATVTGGTISVGGDDVVLHKGTAVFDQADVGTNIPISLVDWYIDGDDAGYYLLVIPTNLKANITKASGVAIAVLNCTPTNNSITAEAILETETGQSVQYARNAANNIADASLTWQDSPTFTGLSAVTNHYIYARSVGNNNYETGTRKVSEMVTTDNPKVYFATSGGSDIEGKTVTKGGKLARNSVADPTRDDYLFDFWYTTAALTTPYDFDNVVNDNITIYARWVSNALIEEMKAKNMLWVKGGSFLMGSPSGEAGRDGTELQHRVTLSGFWMGKYEVTQEEWQDVFGNNPSPFNTAIDGEDGTPQKLPVHSITWIEALKFCNFLSIREGLTPVYTKEGTTNPSLWTHDLYSWTTYVASQSATANGYRVPTIAQWEYACRAGTTTVYSTGATISGNTGWYTDNSEVDSTKRPHKVGLRPTTGNAWGFYDMHGNVREWCWDYYQNHASTSQINPVSGIPVGTEAGSARVARGGSYLGTATTLRSAANYSIPAGSSSQLGECGMRLVLNHQ